MLDRIERVVEKAITKLSAHMDRQLEEATYTTKHKVKNWAIGIASAGVIYYFANEGQAIAAAAFASLAMIGNFAKGELARAAKYNMLRKAKQGKAPKIYTIDRFMEDHDLDITFRIVYINDRDIVILKSGSEVDCKSYIDAVKEGRRGLEELPNAVKFRISKEHTKRGDQ